MTVIVRAHPAPHNTFHRRIAASHRRDLKRRLDIARPCQQSAFQVRDIFDAGAAGESCGSEAACAAAANEDDATFRQRAHAGMQLADRNVRRARQVRNGKFARLTNVDDGRLPRPLLQQCAYFRRGKCADICERFCST